MTRRCPNEVKDEENSESGKKNKGGSKRVRKSRHQRRMVMLRHNEVNIEDYSRVVYLISLHFPIADHDPISF